MLMAAPAIKGIDLFTHSRPLEQPAASGNCTFSGIVPIALQRFKQSGVSVVECPGCGRAWTLSPGGGVLRFKAHPRRKTNTPNTGRRWTRGKDETDWDVVGGSTLPMRQISEKLTGQRCENE